MFSPATKTDDNIKPDRAARNAKSGRPYFSSLRLLHMANALMVINPYWSSGTWVFDDPATGLVREPFVSGVPEMIDKLVTDIPNAKRGFRLLFSATPFPGYQAMFKRV